MRTIRERPGATAWRWALAVLLLAAAIGWAVPVPNASAHVVPTSSVQLAVSESSITAAVSIPLADVEAATGLDLSSDPAAAVRSQTDAIRAYLSRHVAPTSDDGRAWTVQVGTPGVSETGDPATTGRYVQLQVSLLLVPPAGASVRSFDLGWTAIVDRVATHVVLVTVGSDWSSGRLDAVTEVGTVQRDTVTNTIRPLHIDLGAGSSWRGFVSMVRLGAEHIQQGTDHQLFLLTLLLPAPLLAVGIGRRRRWGGTVPLRKAIRRIATITLAFTLGHSITLALGTLGLPVPQHLVEAAIAVSILVAAVHATRPLFPGREAVVAASFGLVHGLAFSETLRELDLSGSHLVLSLLGFNLGVEAMQLVVVALVLPPLILLARAGRYRWLRLTAATITGVAALGWLGARLGLDNPVARAADQLGSTSLPVVAVLWVVALAVTLRRSLGAAGGADLSQSSRSMLTTAVQEPVQPSRVRSGSAG